MTLNMIIGLDLAGDEVSQKEASRRRAERIARERARTAQAAKITGQKGKHSRDAVGTLQLAKQQKAAAAAFGPVASVALVPKSQGGPREEHRAETVLQGGKEGEAG